MSNSKDNGAGVGDGNAAVDGDVLRPYQEAVEEAQKEVRRRTKKRDEAEVELEEYKKEMKDKGKSPSDIKKNADVLVLEKDLATAKAELSDAKAELAEEELKTADEKDKEDIRTRILRHTEEAKEHRQAARDIRKSMNTGGGNALPTGPIDITVIIPEQGDFKTTFNNFPSYDEFTQRILSEQASSDITIFGKHKRAGGHWLRFECEEDMWRFRELAQPYVFTIGARKSGSPASTPERPTEKMFDVNGLADAVKRMSFGGDLLADVLDLCDEIVVKEPLLFDEEHDKVQLGSLGYLFPLVGRENVLMEILTLLESQYGTWNNRNLDDPNVRKGIVIPSWCGASGLGKTRFATNTLECLLAHADGEFKSILQHSVDSHLSLRVDFAGGLYDDLKECDSIGQMISARLLYAFGKQFRRFCDEYRDYRSFWKSAVSTPLDLGSVLDGIADAVCDDERKPLVMFIALDEVNSVEVSHISEAVRCLTSGWQSTLANDKIFVFPFVCGTSSVDLYSATGMGQNNVQPDLLSVGDYISILRSVFGLNDKWNPNDHVLHLLEDVSYNPRLLLLTLYACSMCSYDSASAPVSRLWHRSVSRSAILKFFAEATEDDCVCAFKTLINEIPYANLQTVTVWDKGGMEDILSRVIAYMLFDYVAAANTILGVVSGTDESVSVEKAAKHGWIFVDNGKIVLPYAYLYRMWAHCSHLRRNINNQMPQITYAGTPTRRNRPDTTEDNDVNIIVYRLYLASLAEKRMVDLGWLVGVGVEKDIMIHVPDKLLPIKVLCRRCDRKHLDVISYDSCHAYKNGSNASSWDSCLIIQVASDIPPEYSRRVPIAEFEKSCRTLRAIRVHEEADFDSFENCATTTATSNMMICIQSKVKHSGSLTTDDVVVEYGKVRDFAKKIPFILVIISDGDSPIVPEKLQHQVVVVSSENICSLYGTMLGTRRLQ